MFDQQDGQLELIPDEVDQFHQLADLVGVHAGGWFIQQEQVWIGSQGAGDFHHLLLGDGKLSHRQEEGDGLVPGPDLLRRGIGDEAVQGVERRLQAVQRHVEHAREPAEFVDSEDDRRVVTAPERTRSAYLGRLLVFRDVTREQELDRMKSDLLANVSHDLRTPLASIRAIDGVLAVRYLPAAAEAG